MPQKPSAIVAKFVTIDVHDDTVESVTFVPATSKRSSAKVRVTLFRHWKRRRRTLEFSGCTNVQFIVDADVLLDNAPSNTSGVAASAQVAAVRGLMNRHKSAWGVRYDRAIDPLPQKLKAANALTIFRVQFFGGKLEVVARNYRLRLLTLVRTDAQKTARGSTRRYAFAKIVIDA